MTNDSYKSQYDRIVTYSICAECREPLHIGGGKDAESVLLHPGNGRPFLPATGMTGAIRDYFRGNEKLQKKIFGYANEKNANAEGTGSRIKLTDGFFEMESDTFGMEVRPRVKINGETGACQAKQTKGQNRESGQKFETEVVAAGARFSFMIYLYEDKQQNYQSDIEEGLAALESGSIQFGGQKSNGCGYIHLCSVKKAVYEMCDKHDRKLWVNEGKEGTEISGQFEEKKVDSRLHYKLFGHSNGEIMVKSIVTEDASDDKQKVQAKNIQNYKKNFIIPASSVKGVVRNQMERIRFYKKWDDTLINDIFGTSNEEDSENSKLGCIRFFDIPITGANEGILQYRIHIDKFTGGVMNQHSFQEESASGELQLCIDLTEDCDDRMKGMLLLVMRDIGLGLIPLGGGNSIGRGYIKGSKLQISNGEGLLAEIDLECGSVTKGAETIHQFLQALRGNE